MSNELQQKPTVQKLRDLVTRQRKPSRLKSFHRDEDGAVVAFTLYMFLAFMIIAGVGIDTMRHEMQRSRLAAVADAASLAGAVAPDEDTAKAVVEDYFTKIGLKDNLDAFGEGDVKITLNTAKVTVNTSVDVDTYLMKLVGIDTLSAAATSTAEKRVPKLEIALVLDVSGSMRGDKLTNLKAAAKQFVTTILNSSDSGSAVISIIPFSFGVTPPSEVYNALTVDETHDYSTCLVFTEDDFGDTAIDPDTEYAQQIYTSRYDVSGNFDTLNSSWRSCYTDDYFRFLPYSISEADLHAKIDSLQADGNTSGHLGVKWAAALLDPKFSEVAEVVAPDVANIPAAYNELATQKVIVMMGDGKNTSSYYFNDPNNLLDPSIAETHTASDFRGPNSDLWNVEYDDDVFQYGYYVYNHSYRTYNESNCVNWWWECEYSNETVSSYFLFDRNTAASTDDDRYWDILNEEWLTQAEFDALTVMVDGEEVQEREQLSWEQAWGLMSPDYHEDITGSNAAYNDYVNGETINGSKKNTRMAASCTAAKADGKDVVIYTIGFEISAGGTAETELKKCATSHSHYYRAEGVNINDAFNSIASNIQNLRLTQ